MELFYQKIGEGPALFILHGLYGMSDNWISFGRQLSERFTVYLIDQRNHGRSPHTDTHSYELMANDLNEIFIKESVEKACVIGHSMGGKTAMLFSAMYSNKLSGLIIVDIAPVNYAKVDSYSPQSVFHLNIVNTLLSLDFSQISGRVEIEENLSRTIKDIAVRQFLLKNVLRKPDGTYGWKLNIDTISKALPEIIGFNSIQKYLNGKSLNTFPVLFIRGGKSDYLIPEHYPIVKSIYPEAIIETIPHAGHWVHSEQPAKFTEVLQNFLNLIYNY